MFNSFSKKVLWLFLTLVALMSLSCRKDEVSSSAYTIAVFVPGVLEGSPTYEQMDRGVRKAAEEKGVPVITVEAGFNQGEWKDKLSALAAEGNYSLIVSSNPALSALCREVKEVFPAQQFLVLDGENKADDSQAVFAYNHKEQAFLAGVLAARASLSSLDNLSGEYKLGLIAGQTYPDMEKSIIPGYTMGMKSVDPRFELDFRVVGNWYDAAKASELADSMFRSGVDVILPIAGGANQGVVSEAKQKGKYVVWFDSAGTEQAPGVVLGSAIVRQEKAAEEMVLGLIEGTIEQGDLRMGDIISGYVLLDREEEGYLKHVPAEVQEKINFQIDQFLNGRYSLD
ncbi:MAG: BMP family ABC transporter substrate-binding protein [Spirochaetales bacterium]|nr:BMP family ABC transporter substrate-binding protein [Spirochaetales bacterium]